MNAVSNIKNIYSELRKKEMLIKPWPNLSLIKLMILDQMDQRKNIDLCNS
jgi:hypothetical protein